MNIELRSGVSWLADTWIMMCRVCHCIEINLPNSFPLKTQSSVTVLRCCDKHTDHCSNMSLSNVNWGQSRVWCVRDDVNVSILMCDMLRCNLSRRTDVQRGTWVSKVLRPTRVDRHIMHLMYLHALKISTFFCTQQSRPAASFADRD